MSGESRAAGFENLDRSLPVWVLAALALVILMALPIGWLAVMSVRGEHGVTASHYFGVLGDLQLRKALWNTVIMAFWTGLASVAIGAPLAWLTARTDMPWRGLMRGLVMASFRSEERRVGKECGSGGWAT